MASGTCTMMPFLALLSLLLLAASVHAYPAYYVEMHANGCTDHPTTGLGRHRKPVPDMTTTFTLTAPGAAAPAAALCPGVPYVLTVGYGAARRRTLLTASAGSFESAAGDSCPNLAVSDSSGSTFEDTLTIPCSATGATVQLVVTSAAGSSDAFHTATSSMPLNKAADCPGSTCPGAAAAAPAPAAPAAARATPAAAPAAAAAAAAAAAPAAPAAAPAAAAARSSTVGSSGCGAGVSAYGYACAVPAGGGATLHYSNGGALPENACTRSSSSSSSSSSDVHFLLAAPAGGYAGLSFPAAKGRMVPADAVIGHVDAATGQPRVSAYHLTSYSVSPSPTNFNGAGWASNLGAAKDTGSGNTLLCFSRPLQAPAAAVAKNLDATSLNMNWAAHDSTSYVPHSLTGSLTLDLQSGQAAAAVSGGGNKLAAILAHGALMLLAFAALMPLGALLARHKWLFADKQAGGISPSWFQGHRGIQMTAMVAALAGFIIALVVTDTPWSSSAVTPHPLYNLHRCLGVVAIALTLLQAVLGMVRPGLGAARRPLWRAGHLSLGWLTLAVGVVVMFAGAIMMHELIRQPLVYWITPLALILGLLLLGGIGLEVMKAKAEASGVYHPSSQKYTPAAAGAGAAGQQSLKHNRAASSSSDHIL